MISAIIVNYNTAHLTLDSVRSVLDQQQNTEVLVVDNSVNRNEEHILRSGLPESTTLIVNKVNEGFGRACNQAYLQSRGDMILLLNPDAYLLPGALERLRKTLLAYGDAGAAGPRIYWDDEKKFFLPPSLFPSPWKALEGELWRLHPAFGKHVSFAFRSRALKIWKGCDAIEDEALSGGSVLLARSALEKCGGLFDERYFMYFEDSDLMLRLKRSGYRLYVDPSAEVVHRYEHNPLKMAFMTESSSLYFEKNFGKSRLLGWSRTLAKMQTKSFWGEFPDLGTLSSKSTIEVPEKFRKDWLLELSPSPLFIPSIGHFGSGGHAVIPEDCLRLLHPGNYFCRIGSAMDTVSWRCRI